MKDLTIFFSRIADAYLSRVRPEDETNWHDWNTLFPKRLCNGELYFGQGRLWRRRTAVGWQYKAADSTDEDWWNRRA